MIDMKRLMQKCNAPGRPHLVQINGQWLCMGENLLGAGDTKEEAFGKRISMRQTRDFNTRLFGRDINSTTVDTRKLNPWQLPQNNDGSTPV